MVYVNVKATAQSRRTGRTALVKTRRVVRHGCTHAQRATGTIAIVEFIGLELITTDLLDYISCIVTQVIIIGYK